jgi:hypothetical protein
MMAIDLPDPGFSSEGIIEMHRSTTGHHEDMADTVAGQITDDVIGQSNHKMYTICRMIRKGSFYL